MDSENTYSGAEAEELSVFGGGMIVGLCEGTGRPI